MSSRPVELLKAAVILALGLAMVIAPSIYDENAMDYWTVPRVLVWAWSRPLGILFTIVGLIGVYALTIATRRTTGAEPATS
jgi:hypothetical protein